MSFKYFWMLSFTVCNIVKKVREIPVKTKSTRFSLNRDYDYAQHWLKHTYFKTLT